VKNSQAIDFESGNGWGNRICRKTGLRKGIAAVVLMTHVPAPHDSQKDGKVHRHWCLVRGVRVGRRVIQQTVAHLGELDEHGRIEAPARRLIGTPELARLFDDGSEQLTAPVRVKGIRIDRSRQFGDVYLALALWRGTGVEVPCERCFRPAKSASRGRRWRPC
jgi:hypothetical protein